VTDPPSQSWHQALNLQSTNIDNFYSRPKPGEGFSPLTATADELARSGFPARPDSERDSEAYMRWRHRYGRALRFIEPELVIRPHRARGPMAGPGGSGVTSNWAGSVITANKGQTFTLIDALWTIPRVFPPASGPYSAYTGVVFWSSVTWVGLDGANNLSADVFQAGTEQDNIGDAFWGYSDYFVWTEWFPAPPVAVSNFPVEPGDMISVLLEIKSLDATFLGATFPVGEAFFVNSTRGFFTSVAMAGPPNGGPTPFVGNTAEWIVETPSISKPGSSPVAYQALPFFGGVAFFDPLVMDNEGNILNGSEGTIYSMDNSGNGVDRNGNAPGTGIVVASPAPVVIGIFSDSIGVTDSYPTLPPTEH
jgi:hypothetical protein